MALLALVGCRRTPAPEAATPNLADSASPAVTEAIASESENLPEVHLRGWSIFQEPAGDSETIVSAWAPGDHLKEASSVMVPDLYRQHYHFAEWSHGSLFAIRRFGSTETDAWTDELWEYRDGRDPRRIASGQGLDFRVSPNGERILLVESESGSATTYQAHILDRRGKVLATRRATDYGRENFSPLDMGDSIAYLGADIDNDLYRWSLRSDSLVPVARPAEAIDDRLVLADRDILIASDYPPMADAEELDAFRKGGTPVVLRAFQLRDGRKLELARATGRSFHPVLGKNDSIEIEASTPDSTTSIAAPWR